MITLRLFVDLLAEAEGRSVLDSTFSSLSSSDDELNAVEGETDHDLAFCRCIAKDSVRCPPLVACMFSFGLHMSGGEDGGNTGSVLLLTDVCSFVELGLMWSLDSLPNDLFLSFSFKFSIGISAGNWLVWARYRLPVTKRRSNGLGNGITRMVPTRARKADS